MKNYYYLVLFILFTQTGCSNSSEITPEPNGENKLGTLNTGNNTIIASFSFVGCNRIKVSTKEVPSTANVPVLNRIFKESAAQIPKPKLFFFIGDMVQGKDLKKIPGELDGWKDLYNKSDINQSDIEMVAIPGNHEMLYKVSEDNEQPLDGATAVWVDHMAAFIPKDRDSITHDDKTEIGYHNNRATFSFIREFEGLRLAFIVINTDSYDKAHKTEEGKIPTDWILKKTTEYQQDNSINHIFVLGHKPCYTGGKGKCLNGKSDDCKTNPCFKIGHGGLPNSKELWDGFNKNNKVTAYLSAHLHCYQHWQPDSKGTHQIIAGHGGSTGGETKWFGYSTINIYQNKKVELVTMGFSSKANSINTSSTEVLEKVILNYDNTKTPSASYYDGNCNCTQ